MGDRTRRVGAFVIGFAIPLLALSSAGASLPRDSVGTAQLERGAVTTPKLAFHAVETRKLGKKAVTIGKLAREIGELGQGRERLAQGLGHRPADARLRDPPTPDRRGVPARKCDPRHRQGRQRDLYWPAGQPPAWKLTGNAGTDPAHDFLGTTDATSLELRVNDALPCGSSPTPSARI